MRAQLAGDPRSMSRRLPPARKGGGGRVFWQVAAISAAGLRAPQRRVYWTQCPKFFAKDRVQRDASGPFKVGARANLTRVAVGQRSN